MRFRRHALYHLPGGALGDFGADWLGWDVRTGRSLPPGIGPADIVAAPRRYGFHATLKAPFRLADGRTPEELADAAQGLCEQLAPFALRLELGTAWGFLSLRPPEQPPELPALESALVTRLDGFRAPLTEAERARRRPEALPEPARAHLERWGYPFVLDLFRYHLTLSGPLATTEAEALRERLVPHLAPLIAQPMPVGAVALAGEDEDGFFHRIAEFPLRGQVTAS